MILDDADLPDRVTIVHRPASTGRDRFGNREVDWTTAARDEDVPASVQPQAGAENVTDTDRRTIRMQLFLGPEWTLTALDRVEVDDDTYEVDGQPKRWRLDGADDHIEATLLRIEVS